MFYAWLLASDVKYFLVNNEIGLISAKRSFKGYSENYRKIKLEYFISLSEGKSMSGRFLIDWSKTSERIEKPHRKDDCLDCDI